MSGGQELEIVQKCTKIHTITLLLFKVKDMFRNIKIGFTNENGCDKFLVPLI